jgi:hypothetical protein
LKIGSPGAAIVQRINKIIEEWVERKSIDVEYLTKLTPPSHLSNNLPVDSSNELISNNQNESLENDANHRSNMSNSLLKSHLQLNWDLSYLSGMQTKDKVFLIITFAFIFIYWKKKQKIIICGQLTSQCSTFSVLDIVKLLQVESNGPQIYCLKDGKY